MKKILKTVLFTLLFFAILPLSIKAESSNLSLNFEAGIQGKVKMEKGFPLRITATNNGDTPFDGDLVIRFATGGSPVGGKVIPISVEPGETRTVTTSLAGMSDWHYYGSNPTDQIFLYKGDWQDQKQVTFSGSTQLNLSFIDINNKVVGIISENHDRLANIKGINRSLHYLNITEENFPQDIQGMELFDLIILDDYPISKISERKQQALIDWISSGGILIVGSTPFPENTYGKLHELLPMKTSDELVISPVFGGNTNQPVAFDNIQVFTGEVEPQTVEQAFNQIPILLNKKLGNGRIIQTAFSLGDQPVTSTEGYGDWFARYLSTLNSSNKNYQHDMNHQLYYNFGEINEIFSSNNISTTQLLTILLIYLLVLVPVLFFILKRIDKREHTWWLIPTISILTSLLIFGYGAKDRIFSPLINELGLFVANNNYLDGFYTVSFQSNTSGDYELTVSSGEYSALPISQYYYSNDISDSPVVYFEEQREQKRMTFPKVEYWSVRSLSGKANTFVDGMFNEEISLSDKKLSGTITNQYPYDFDNVFIWTGREEFDLGPMGSGDTVEVDLDLNKEWMNPPIGPSYYNSREDDIDTMVRHQLKYAFSDQGYFSLSSPVIAGFTKDQIIDLEMDRGNVKSNRTALILQPFDPEVTYSGSGEFNLSKNDLSIELVTLEGNMSNYFPGPSFFQYDEIYVDPGIYQLHYQLPSGLQQQGVSLSSLKLSFPRGMNKDPFFIVNQKTGELEPLNDLGINIELIDNPSDYLTVNNSIVFQVEKQNMDNPDIYLPEIQIKGSVAR